MLFIIKMKNVYPSTILSLSISTCDCCVTGYVHLGDLFMGDLELHFRESVKLNMPSVVLVTRAYGLN